MALIINRSDHNLPQLPESSITPHSSAYATDFLQLSPQRKHSNRTERSSMSSALTYKTSISQKIMPSRLPSYPLSPSRSYRPPMTSTPHTATPTLEDMYGQQGAGVKTRPGTRDFSYPIRSKIMHAAVAWVDQTSTNNSTFSIRQHSTCGADERGQRSPTFSHEVEALK